MRPCTPAGVKLKAVAGDEPCTDSSHSSGSVACHSQQARLAADADNGSSDTGRNAWQPDQAEAGAGAVQQTEPCASWAPITFPLAHPQLPPLSTVPEYLGPEHAVPLPVAQQPASWQPQQRRWQQQQLQQERQQQSDTAGSARPQGVIAAGPIRDTGSEASAQTLPITGHLRPLRAPQASGRRMGEPLNPFASTPALVQPWSPGPSPLRCPRGRLSHRPF
jgi:hypothetical protein